LEKVGRIHPITAIPHGLYLRTYLCSKAMDIVKSILIFLLAGICEIGGGYLIWLWLKEEKPIWFGLLGDIILAFYGMVATLQTANFGRVYAT
jgi:small multidrug resistance family-3 protein